MNNKKLLISLLSIISLVMFSSSSFSATKSPNKSTYTKKTYSKSQKQRTQSVRTKEYRVPGSAAVGYARPHGYIFTAMEIKERNSTSRRQHCKYVGNHWQIGRNENCKLIAFKSVSRNQKCKVLRKGWKIKKVEISGSYRWDRREGRPVNTSEAHFIFWSDNKSRPTYPVSIKTITLIGPEGPANKWQEAFNHCSDPSYKP